MRTQLCKSRDPEVGVVVWMAFDGDPLQRMHDNFDHARKMLGCARPPVFEFYAGPLKAAVKQALLQTVRRFPSSAQIALGLPRADASVATDAFVVRIDFPLNGVFRAHFRAVLEKAERGLCISRFRTAEGEVVGPDKPVKACQPSTLQTLLHFARERKDDTLASALSILESALVLVDISNANPARDSGLTDLLRASDAIVAP